MTDEHDDDPGKEDNHDKRLTIFRTIFLGAAQMIQGIILFKFSRKYYHISLEIPMMYNGVLSNMDISKKWNCINFAYFFFTVCINALA
jgi:hypothetical protein